MLRISINYTVVKRTGTFLAIGRLAIAAVLLVASSGFTIVLHSCLMEGASCCDAMAAGGPMHAGRDRAADGVHLSKVPSSCCESTLVGGLNGSTAAIENQAAPHDLKGVLAVAGPALSGGQAEAGSPILAFRQFRPPDPPPCGLYISNAALLI